MENAISRILITARAIRKRIHELGEMITGEYQDSPLTLVVLSNGALIFGADLARAIRTPLQLDTLGVRSYEGQHSSGAVAVYGDMKLVATGRRILVVDDILDTGRTLQVVCEHLRAAGALDVRTCVLLNKIRPRDIPIQPDYTGFDIEDEFVVGYGLDFDEQYRNLPHIGVLNPDLPAAHRARGAGAMPGIPWEEWQEEQVRVAAATLHNIGNALTVARLTIDEIRSESGVREALELLTDDIWPEIQANIENGTVGEFFADENGGKEYPDMVSKLLGHASKSYIRRRKAVIAVTAKLEHIASILDVHNRLTTAPAPPVTVYLDDVLDDAMTLVRESAEKYDVALEPSRQRGLFAWTDRVLLTDAIVNIFTNAIDAMRNEDPTQPRKISIRTRSDGEHVVCSVANTGPLVPAEVAARIFEFGYSTKSGAGRGIGLHFARRILESHGGELYYEMDADGAPAFHLRLRAAEPGNE